MPEPAPLTLPLLKETVGALAVAAARIGDRDSRDLTAADGGDGRGPGPAAAVDLHARRDYIARTGIAYGNAGDAAAAVGSQ